MTKKKYTILLSKNEHSRAIIQALVSQVELAFKRYDSELLDLTKHCNLYDLIESVLKVWVNIQKTLDFATPPLLLESAIFAYSGSKTDRAFQELELTYDSELVPFLIEWLKVA